MWLRGVLKVYWNCTRFLFCFIFIFLNGEVGGIKVVSQTNEASGAYLPLGAVVTSDRTNWHQQRRRRRRCRRWSSFWLQSCRQAAVWLLYKAVGQTANETDVKVNWIWCRRWPVRVDRRLCPARKWNFFSCYLFIYFSISLSDAKQNKRTLNW